MLIQSSKRAGFSDRRQRPPSLEETAQRADVLKNRPRTRLKSVVPHAAFQERNICPVRIRFAAMELQKKNRLFVYGGQPFLLEMNFSVSPPSLLPSPSQAATLKAAPLEARARSSPLRKRTHAVKRDFPPFEKRKPAIPMGFQPNQSISSPYFRFFFTRFPSPGVMLYMVRKASIPGHGKTARRHFCSFCPFVFAATDVVSIFLPSAAAPFSGPERLF